MITYKKKILSFIIGAIRIGKKKKKPWETHFFRIHINTAIRFHYKNKKNEIQLEIYASQGKGKFSLTINK